MGPGERRRALVLAGFVLATLVAAVPPASAATVLNVIDLSIEKSASTADTEVGATISYTLVVSNAGPSDAPVATVTDQLPEEVRFISVETTPPGLPCSHDGAAQGGEVGCDLGALPAGGAGATVTIDVEVLSRPASGCFSNAATADGELEVRLDPDDEDPLATWTEQDQSDNDDDAEVCVPAPPPPAPLDLSVVVEQEGTSGFMVTVVNLTDVESGPIEAAITIRDELTVVDLEGLGPQSSVSFRVDLDPGRRVTGTITVIPVEVVIRALEKTETNLTNNTDVEPIVLEPQAPGDPDLSGIVFLDEDGDRVRDDGEESIPGALVTAGPFLGVNTADGFAFRDIPQGRYAVAVEESSLPAGLLPSTSPVLIVDFRPGDQPPPLTFGYARGEVLGLAIAPEVLPATGIDAAALGLAGAALAALGVVIAVAARRRNRAGGEG